MTLTVLFVALVLAVPAEGALLRSRAKEQLKDETGLWRPCANEGETIAEEGLVRFGFGLTFVEGNVPRGASCAVSTFGQDPSPGIMKMCECSGVPPAGLGDQRQVLDDMGMTG